MNIVTVEADFSEILGAPTAVVSLPAEDRASGLGQHLHVWHVTVGSRQLTVAEVSGAFENAGPMLVLEPKGHADPAALALAWNQEDDE